MEGKKFLWFHSQRELKSKTMGLIITMPSFRHKKKPSMLFIKMQKTKKLPTSWLQLQLK